MGLVFGSALQVKLAAHLLSTIGYERTQNQIPANTIEGLKNLPSKYIPTKIQALTPNRSGVGKAYCLFIYNDSIDFNDYKAMLLDSRIADIVAPEYIAEKKPLGCAQAINDAAYPYLWHLNDDDDGDEADINAPEAWEFTQGSPEVIIAIAGGGANFIWDPELNTNYWVNDIEDIDHDGQLTAADINNIDDDGNGYIDDVIGWHTDRQDNRPDYEIEPPPPGTSDDKSHGTDVMKSAGAIIDNTPWYAGDSTRGYTGSAPNCKLMCVGGSSMRDVILYLLSFKTRTIGQQFIPVILAFSWPIIPNQPILQSIVTDAFNNGMLVVNAAGNDEHYPIVYYVNPFGISVACLADGNGRGNSTYGSKVSISAPSTQQATSYATSVVAGIVGLMKSYDNSLTPSQLRTKLLESVNPIRNYVPPLWSSDPSQSLLGTGRVDAFQAIAQRKVSPLTYYGIPQNLSGPIFICPSTYPNIDPIVDPVFNPTPGVDTISFPYGETINLGSPNTLTVLKLPDKCTLLVTGTLNITQTVKITGGAIKFMNGAKLNILDGSILSICGTSLTFGNGTTEWAFSNGRMELDGVLNAGSPNITVPIGTILKLSGIGTLSCASNQTLYVQGQVFVEPYAEIEFDPVTKGRIIINTGGLCRLKENSSLSEIVSLFIFREGWLDLLTASIEMSQWSAIICNGKISASNNSSFVGKNHADWMGIDVSHSTSEINFSFGVILQDMSRGLVLFNTNNQNNSLYGVQFIDNNPARTGTAINLSGGSYLKMNWIDFDATWNTDLSVNGSEADIDHCRFKEGVTGATFLTNSAVYTANSAYSQNLGSGIVVNNSSIFAGYRNSPNTPGFNRIDDNGYYGIDVGNNSWIKFGDINPFGQPHNAYNALTSNFPKAMIILSQSVVEGDLNWYGFAPISCNGGSYSLLQTGEKSSIYDTQNSPPPQINFGLCNDDIPVFITSAQEMFSKGSSIASAEEIYRRARRHVGSNAFRSAHSAYDSLFRYHSNSPEAFLAISQLYYCTKNWIRYRPDSALTISLRVLTYFDSIRVLNIPALTKRRFASFAAALHRDYGSVSVAEQLYLWLTQQNDSLMKRNAMNNLIAISAREKDSSSVKYYWNLLVPMGVSYAENQHYNLALRVAKYSKEYNLAPAPSHITEVTDNRSISVIPGIISLDQNSPNPFTSISRIKYSVLKTEPIYVSLKLYDVLGQEIKVIREGMHGFGSYHVTFDTGDLPSGMYFYILINEQNQLVRKMIITR